MKPIVIMNQTHSLMQDQQDVLDKTFPQGFDILGVPADGWTLQQQLDITQDLIGKTVVFVSPVPVLLAKATKLGVDAYVFHNDNRDKKQLPNGKIIMVVAQTGWQLIHI